MIQIPVCNGELVDKLTILEIKKSKMNTYMEEPEKPVASRIN